VFEAYRLLGIILKTVSPAHIGDVTMRGNVLTYSDGCGLFKIEVTSTNFMDTRREAMPAKIDGSTATRPLKVGDRVRVVNNEFRKKHEWLEVPVGTIGTIKEYDTQDPREMCWRIAFSGGGSGHMATSEIELVSDEAT
jgi:hypothetical protein